MAEEEKQEQEETAAEEQAPAEEPTEAEEAAAEPAAEEETPAEEAAAEGEADEGGSAGTSDEVAVGAEVPAATPEPEPDTGREAEDVGGVIPEASGGDVPEASGGKEVLSPKQLRKSERSRASGPPRPARAPEERAAERAERRRASAEGRRRYRAARRGKRGEPAPGTPPALREPGSRKVRQGTVVSARGDKTITVEIAVVRRHPTYEKVVRKTSKLRAHDEGNQARQGDVVRLVESRPLSRTKRWRLLDVLEQAPR